MEDALKPSGWLVGKAYSIADIAAVPFVKRIDEEIAPDEVTANKHPRVTEWWTKIQARPAFARANIGPFLDCSAQESQGGLATANPSTSHLQTRLSANLPYEPDGQIRAIY